MYTRGAEPSDKVSLWPPIPLLASLPTSDENLLHSHLAKLPTASASLSPSANPQFSREACRVFSIRSFDKRLEGQTITREYEAGDGEREGLRSAGVTVLLMPLSTRLPFSCSSVISAAEGSKSLDSPMNFTEIKQNPVLYYLHPVATFIWVG